VVLAGETAGRQLKLDEVIADLALAAAHAHRSYDPVALAVLQLLIDASGPGANTIRSDMLPHPRRTRCNEWTKSALLFLVPTHRFHYNLNQNPRTRGLKRRSKRGDIRSGTARETPAIH
jgi:hypothetical protein